MLRVVLDSNVILSGQMSPKGTTGQIVQAWKDNRFNLFICQAHKMKSGGFWLIRTTKTFELVCRENKSLC